MYKRQQKNWAAIDAGAKQVVEIQVPESWKDAEDEGLFMACLLYTSVLDWDLEFMCFIRLLRWSFSSVFCWESDLVHLP